MITTNQPQFARLVQIPLSRLVTKFRVQRPICRNRAMGTGDLTRCSFSALGTLLLAVISLRNPITSRGEIA